METVAAMLAEFPHEPLDMLMGFLRLDASMRQTPGGTLEPGRRSDFCTMRRCRGRRPRQQGRGVISLFTFQ